LASIFLDALSFGLIFPILPRLILGLAGHDTAYAARVFGLMTAAWALMNFIASPVLGALSDRFGRRPVILISTFGLSVDFLVMALAPNVAWLFAGRAMSGLTAASGSAASAYLADTTPPDERARRFGLFFAVSGAGFIMGPAAGGLLAAITPRAPFFAAAGLAALGWLYGLLILPESLPPELRTRTPLRHANPVRAFGILARDGGLLGLAAVGTLIQLGAQAVNIVFVLYTAHRYHWSVAQVGLLLTVFCGGNILVMGVMAPRLARRIGERATVLWGVALSAIGFVGLGLAPTGPAFCLACVPTCLGNICAPPLQSLQTKRVGPTEQGRLQGALSALQALNALVGPIFFTQVFAWSIAPGWAMGMSGLSLLIAAGLMAAALPCAIAVARSPRRVEAAA
ncbi:MAG TPA: MFS transporter, partial [Caulobacteraceae bacterium]|nr:MFS transporter [Caulobacteraceae bacterium]